MSSYRDQVAGAVDAVTIRSPTGYAWLGHPSRPLPRALRELLSGLDCRRHLIAALREELYSSFYTTGGAVPARSGRIQPVAADPRLTWALSNANTGHGNWEPEWIVDSCHGDKAIVSTRRVRVCVSAGDYRTDDGGPIGPGAAVSIRLPKELPARSPGFFVVLGTAGLGAIGSRGTLRVYWHITAAGGPPLVRYLTSRLNAETVPFRLKVADHPVRFNRCDAAVLYLPIEAFDLVREMLAHVAAMLTSRLRPRTPAFTLALAPGVGLAESPASGASFGESRCGLLADGIVDAAQHGLAPGVERLEAVIGSLAANGVRIEAPYLEPSLDGQHVL